MEEEAIELAIELVGEAVLVAISFKLGVVEVDNRNGLGPLILAEPFRELVGGVGGPAKALKSREEELLESENRFKEEGVPFESLAGREGSPVSLSIRDASELLNC